MTDDEHDFDGTIEHLKKNGLNNATIDAVLHEAVEAKLRPASFHQQTPHHARPPGTPGAKRGDGEVVVFGRQEVMDVFQDAGDNYSVCGYAERSNKAFGTFFLGMDPGPEYDLEGGAINAAIMSMTLADGFQAGADATDLVLPKISGDPPDPQDLTDRMLAEVCRGLFGLPDGHLVTEGSMKFHLFTPALCPGDYAPMSGHIFFPDPGVLLTLAGRHLGQQIKEQTVKFVEDLRRASSPPEAKLTRVLFDTIPPDQNDRFARTLVGVMMGLLPTIEGNMVQALKSMHADGSYYGLASQIRDLSNPRDPQAIDAILRAPLFRAIQAGPMPPAVWRTAKKDHVIGGVEVKKGDKINIAIKSAALEDLKNGSADVTPVFGGNRSASPHPTHACPGYELAIGIMFGTFAAVMNAGR